MSLANHGSESSTAATVDEINLGVVGRLIWNGRWLILAIALALAAVAFGILGLMHKRYEATVTVSPASEDVTASSSRSGGLASQLGGLASLTGLSGSESGFKAEALATLKSEALTEQFVRENDLLPILFAKRWDTRKNAWDTSDPKKIPTLWKANQLFLKRIRTVSENSKTGLFVVTISWTDPSLAAKWANGVVKMTNAYLRDKAIGEEERRIAYLKKEVANTNVVELQQAIYSLIENEIKKEMLARGNDEYALKIIDPATAPEEPAGPGRLVLTAATFAGGLLLGMVFVLARGRIG